jgi:hypothetical protein
MYSMLPHIRIAALVLSYLILPDEYVYSLVLGFFLPITAQIKCISVGESKARIKHPLESTLLEYRGSALIPNLVEQCE